jgi:hypothetical protein
VHRLPGGQQDRAVRVARVVEPGHRQHPRGCANWTARRNRRSSSSGRRRSAPSPYREAPSPSPYKCSNCPYGLGSPRLVVLSRAVRERPRVGTRPDHGQLVAVRLCPGGRGERGRGAGAYGGVLRGLAGVQVGVVPAAVRAAAIKGPS